ncbi:SdrD B-like domain-containing protein [Microbacterium sp. LWH12-1.2]|uniref:SdrD B-like domain-containing protein n=1 Tax=Microbacterium sp. LWH12-1.2 TaxID=3135259 RepID=UPI0034298413
MGGASSAVAATGDGTISVTVVQDANVNRTHDGLDVALSGVQVRIHDIDGEFITVETDGDGVATLAAAENTLVGGRYRIEVVNPNASIYSEAQIADGHSGAEFAPAVSFVDVRNGADTAFSVGYVDYTTLGVDGARLYSAVLPNDIWPEQNNGVEVYGIDYKLNGSASQITSTNTIGAVYGIGIDSENLDLYAGAYAKRGSLYGPGGSGAIYRVNTVTGDWEIYTTVADAGGTEHDLGPMNPADGFVHHDFDFRTAVGREALGDVDVTPDNRFLTTINLNTEELVVYPVQEALNPAPLQTLQIAAPDTCESDWAPMGLGQREGNLFVGAVCGSDMESYVLEYERAEDGTVGATPISVVQGQVSETVPRAGQNGPFGGSLHSSCDPVDWRVWTDDVPQLCINGGLNAPAVGWWPQFVVPQPMLGDVEFVENGEMVLSFRDRSGDQYGLGMYVGQKEGDTPSYGNVVATGDLVAFAEDVTALDFANPAHDFSDTGAFHAQAAFSGVATVPGSGTIVSNTMDATGAINSNGLRAYDVNTGQNRGNALVTTAFFKGMGLADLEALVLEQTQQIGNRIWSDTDQDGVQGPTEGGIAGIQVSLYDVDGNVVATTETDANGEYWFDTADGLLPDTEYEVRLDRASDFEAGGPLAGYSPTEFGAGPNRGIDSNGEVSDADIVFASVTTPAAGVNDHSIDFGFVPTLVSVGDYVWFDEDRDGIQDADETPVAGVEVILHDRNGVEVARTTTDADGYYVFTDLVASSEYSIQFPMTATIDGETVALTRPNAGDDDAADSDADPETGRVTFTTPVDGENSAEPGLADDPTIDAGYVLPVLVSVGDYVWLDTDRDGIQEAGERPLPGVEVILYDGEGVEVARTTTDSDGYYVFTDLTPSGEYTIQFPTTVTVDGEQLPLTQPGAGSDRGADSNPGADGRYSFTAPASGDNSGEPGQADDPTIDAGYVIPSVSVGDFVWIDTDGDGVQDAGEPGIPDAVLTLTGPDGEPVTNVFGDPVPATKTDSDGKYSFDDLPALEPGQSYTVTVTPPAGYKPTTPGVGEGETDSSTGSAASGDLTVDGARDATLDFGFVPDLVSIGDYVWLDDDRDGIQDAGERPLPGVTVKLFDEDGELVAETTTDENGYYAFTDLQPSTDYFLEFPTSVELDGEWFTLTQPGQGSDRAADSNADPATGRVPVTTPAEGNNSGAPGEADEPTYDVGYVLSPVEPTPTPAGGGLPATGGANLLPIGGLALALMIGGAVIFIARRRAAQQ